MEKFGPQVDNVLELQVVTGEDELQSVSTTKAQRHKKAFFRFVASCFCGSVYCVLRTMTDTECFGNVTTNRGPLGSILF